jgi:hypothetical protein
MILLTGAVLVGVTGCSRSAPQDRTEAPAPPTVAATTLAGGTHTCSNQGCHGGLDVDETPRSRSSFTRWLQRDPHADAYEALKGELAQRMAKLLNFDVASDARCLACHVSPTALGPGPQAARERAFGIGCEACHGSAAKWLGPHRDWQSQGLSNKDQYDKHSMTWLVDLRLRAEVCVDCHVGAPAQGGMPAREVTHDFIAAGHPRLMFEFGSYQANLPRHWAEKEQGRDFEARSWLVGQAVSAAAALRLLCDQTSPARRADWPELAAYDCYACHRSLDSDSGRPAAVTRLPRLSPWYTAVAPSSAAPDLGIGKLTLTDVASTMSAERINERATKALAQLSSLSAQIAKVSCQPDNLARWRSALLAKAREPGAGWDELEQVALALAALDEADSVLHAGQPTGPPPKRHGEGARQLLELLRFPDDSASPTQFRRGPQFERRLNEVLGSLE